MTGYFFGTFAYRSFISVPGESDSYPNVTGWSDSGWLSLDTQEDGTVKGIMNFGEQKLQVRGNVIFPAGSSTPRELALSIESGESNTGEPTVMLLRGHFVDSQVAGLAAIGTTVALKNGLDQKPAGTSGPFILYPLP